MNTITDAMTYPWRGSAKWVLFWLVMLALGSHLAGFAPLVGFIATLLIAAYFCATYCHLIELSTSEEDLPVTFPDLSNILGDLIIPTVRMIVIMIITVLPAILYVSTTGGHTRGLFFLLTLAPGMIYAPMALLGWIVLNNPIAISPHIVIPSIIRVGLPYLWIVFLIFVISALNTLLGPDDDSPFLIGIILAEITSVYLMMSNARLIGIIYRNNKEQLGWL